MIDQIVERIFISDAQTVISEQGKQNIRALDVSAFLLLAKV